MGTQEISSGDNNTRSRFKILMAYTDNYHKVGDLCATVNEEYALRHNYEFRNVVLPDTEVLEKVSPRGHATWYKVLLFIEELEAWLNANPSQVVSTSGGEDYDEVINNSASISSPEDEYLVWLDADAEVIAPEKKLEHIVAFGNGKDLIIGEDMHLGNLVNCGVIFIKKSQWSYDMWKQVWELQVRKKYKVGWTQEVRDKIAEDVDQTKSNRKQQKKSKEQYEWRTCYFDRPFYEQSALLLVLKRRQEFESFLNEKIANATTNFSSPICNEEEAADKEDMNGEKENKD